MPVPASKMKRRPSRIRTSRQGVLPPNLTVSGPGLAMEPRVPQQDSLDDRALFFCVDHRSW